MYMLTVVSHRLCVGHLYLKFGNERKEDRALQLCIKSVLGCYRRDVWMSSGTAGNRGHLFKLYYMVHSMNIDQSSSQITSCMSSYKVTELVRCILFCLFWCLLVCCLGSYKAFESQVKDYFRSIFPNMYTYIHKTLSESSPPKKKVKLVIIEYYTVVFQQT